jgi:drug/metabolite transporter (DMT)-like permease
MKERYRVLGHSESIFEDSTRELQEGARLKTSRHIPYEGALLLVMLTFLWGGNIVSIKIGNQGIGPILAGTLRSVVASVCLWLYARHLGKRVFVDWTDLGHALTIGVLFGTEFLLLYWGTDFTNASRAVIFLYTQPLWTAVLAHLALRGERLTWTKGIGMTVAFGGLVAVFASRPATLGPHYWIGDLMEMAAGLLWAAVTVYIKRFMSDRPIDHHQILFSQLFFSIPVMALGWALWEYHRPVVLLPQAVAAVLYQSVVIAFWSYLLWFWMIGRYPVVRLAAFTFLTPLFGVILSGLVLKEPLTGVLLIGLTLVAIGIYMVNRPDGPVTPAS